MPLPTLLRRGFLRVWAGPLDGGGLEPVDDVPIEWLTAWVRARMPEYGGAQGGARFSGLANRVLAVRSRTGSGKSTAMPAALFRVLRDARAGSARYDGPSVLCTQPKVLTAVQLAEQMAADRDGPPPGTLRNPDLILGETLGYTTGPLKNRPARGLIYATAGTLRAMLAAAEGSPEAAADFMARHRFIIVDEAHERSLDSDMLMWYLRRFYAAHADDPRLPFLLMASATFDPAKYAAYFGVANVVDVEGSTHPIADVFAAVGTNDYPAAAAAVVADVEAREPAAGAGRVRDLLVFVPGGAAATAVVQAYRKLAGGAKRAKKRGEASDGAGAADERASAAGALQLIPINSEAVNEQSAEYRAVFAPAAGRRVVLATNVAETGLTIDTLRHVVDPGWARQAEAYWPGGYAGVLTRPAPRSRVTQRRGRCGRVAPGVFHALYTENVWRALPEQQAPDIVAQGCGSVLAELAAAPGGLDPAATGLLDPPPAAALFGAAARLAAAGLLVAGGAGPAYRYHATAAGRLAAAARRTPPEAVRAALEALARGVAVADVATAAALGAFGNNNGAGAREKFAHVIAGRRDEVAAVCVAFDAFGDAVAAHLAGATGGTAGGGEAYDIYGDRDYPWSPAAGARGGVDEDGEDDEIGDGVRGGWAWDAERAARGRPQGRAARAAPGAARAPKIRKSARTRRLGELLGPASPEASRADFDAFAELNRLREDILADLAAAGLDTAAHDGARLSLHAGAPTYAAREAAFARCLAVAYPALVDGRDEHGVEAAGAPAGRVACLGLGLVEVPGLFRARVVAGLCQPAAEEDARVPAGAPGGAAAGAPGGAAALDAARLALYDAVCAILAEREAAEGAAPHPAW